MVTMKYRMHLCRKIGKMTYYDLDPNQTKKTLGPYLRGSFLISVSHLLGFGGFFEDIFLFAREALDARIVDLFQDTIHFDF